MKTVVQILENSSELAVKEFVAFTIENRKCKIIYLFIYFRTPIHNENKPFLISKSCGGV
jgi:hypothetical protein